jgi:hypothetical protein
MPAPSRIEAFAIISADGMIADVDAMPDALKVEADQQFFHAGLTRGGGRTWPAVPC